MPNPLRDLARQLEERASQLEERIRRGLFPPGGAEQAGDQQPAFAGAWRTSSMEGLDEFLDRSMGVGGLKRKIASKAAQTQKLRQEGRVIHLELTDKRGTSRYEIRPDGKERAGRGFQKLPITQTARMSDGALVVEERYAQHLGPCSGGEHGAPCEGADCPVVHSKRWVEGGEMLVELERTLPSGEVLRMKTHYAPLPGHGGAPFESPLAHRKRRPRLARKQRVRPASRERHANPGESPLEHLRDPLEGA